MSDPKDEAIAGLFINEEDFDLDAACDIIAEAYTDENFNPADLTEADFLDMIIRGMKLL